MVAFIRRNNICYCCCRIYCQLCRLLQRPSRRRISSSHSSATDGPERSLSSLLSVRGNFSTSLLSSAKCSTGCQCVNGYYTCIRLLLPPSTVSMALAQHTSSTFARRLLTSLVRYTSVLLNAATCWFLAPELSSADGVFQLLH